MDIKRAIEILEKEKTINCIMCDSIKDPCNSPCDYIKALDKAISALYLLIEAGVIK